jgi:cyclase
VIVRIIPRLDIKGPNVVKGVHLEGLRVVGLPEDFAKAYYEQGADELVYLDQVASLYGRNNLEGIVRRTAEQVFIPLTVGGGIRTLEDIQQLLRAGADKVAINTGAIRNPDLIRQGAQAFGSQCIVLYVEAKERGTGKYECLTDNARERSGLDLFDWVKKAVDLGAGEILLTSVDREGTGKGYDLELTAKVSTSTGVPVIASGGAGEPQHIAEAITLGKADAVCAASIFHYALIEEMEVRSERFEEGNIEFLQRKLPIPTLGRRRIQQTSIPELKAFFNEKGIPIRKISKRSEKEEISIGHSR